MPPKPQQQHSARDRRETTPATLMRLLGDGGEWRRMGSSPLSAVHSILHGDCCQPAARPVAARVHRDGANKDHVDFLLADGTIDCPDRPARPYSPGRRGRRPRSPRSPRGACGNGSSVVCDKAMAEGAFLAFPMDISPPAEPEVEPMPAPRGPTREFC